MSKQICLNPVFMALRGNYNAKDEHGHQETLRLRETSWGKKYFGLGTGSKRDLSVKPYSQDELTQQSAFSNASSLRKKILASASLKNTWRSLFKDATEKSSTTAHTLNGYIMQQAILGNVSDDGSYNG